MTRVLSLGCCVAALDVDRGCALLVGPLGADIADPFTPTGPTLHELEWSAAVRVLDSLGAVVLLDDEYGGPVEEPSLPDGRRVWALSLPALGVGDFEDIRTSYSELRAELSTVS